MKAVVVTGANQYGIQDVTLDPPQAGEIRLKMKACGICLSDHHVISQAIPIPVPVVLGHEGAGVVAEVGPGVTDFAVGDHVVANFNPACGKCQLCQKGEFSQCQYYSLEDTLSGCLPGGETRFRLSDGTPAQQFMALGVMAEETVIKETFAVKVDPSINLTHACTVSCGVMTGAGGAINTGGVKPGDAVAVFGCGGVGLNAIQGAKIAGATRIIAIDLADNKLEMARKMGATHTINSGNEDPVASVMEITGMGVDIALECVGIPALVGLAFNTTRPKGKTVVIGVAPSQETTPIDPFVLMGTSRQVCGHKASGGHSAHFISTLLDHYQGGKLDLGSLVTSTYSIDQVDQAFTDLLNNVNARGVIVFD
jgi:S-(hydroxymethyl)glutathione dehydrogenase/alcohol dehydrogenase